MINRWKRHGQFCYTQKTFDSFVQKLAWLITSRFIINHLSKDETVFCLMSIKSEQDLAIFIVILPAFLALWIALLECILCATLMLRATNSILGWSFSLSSGIFSMLHFKMLAISEYCCSIISVGSSKDLLTINTDLNSVKAEKQKSHLKWYNNISIGILCFDPSQLWIEIRMAPRQGFDMEITILPSSKWLFIRTVWIINFNWY